MDFKYSATWKNNTELAIVIYYQFPYQISFSSIYERDLKMYKFPNPSVRSLPLQVEKESMKAEEDVKGGEDLDKILEMSLQSAKDDEERRNRLFSKG